MRSFNEDEVYFDSRPSADCPNAEFSEWPDECPECGDQMVRGTGEQRLDLERVKKSMATSAEGEERLMVEFAIQHCIKCGMSRGLIEPSGYAGY